MKTKQVVAVAFAILFSLSTLTLIANDKKVEKKEDSSLPDGIRFQNHSEDFVS